MFSTLDLSAAFHQLELTEESKKYTTVNTHKGLYHFNKVPYGIASAPAIFQETMEKILNGIPRVAIFIDDVIISGTSVEEHNTILKQVLDRFREFGVRVRKEKCEVFKEQVTYLGFVINKEGKRPSASNVEAILNAPAPSSVSQLRSFLGTVNYYSSFIPNLSTLLKPLHRMLVKGMTWSWDDSAEMAFKKLKRILASDQVLTHYSSDLPLVLACDASQVGIGCVLSHILPNGEEKPVAYASKTLSSSQRAYAQIEREALAIIYGIEKFHQFLFGRKFTLLTDHKALSIIFNSSRAIPQMAAARLQRWAIKLSAFSFDVKYRNTNLHANCDGLSRLPVQQTFLEANDATVFHVVDSLPVSAAEIRRETRKDKVLSQVLRWTQFGWPDRSNADDQHPESPTNSKFRPYLSRSSELSCIQDVLLWGSRVIIPTKLRIRMLEELHSSHAGASKMKSLGRSYFWFPGMDKEIERIANECRDCAAVQKMPNASTVHPWEYPSAPWSRIHIDLAGPFMQNDFLILYDAGSKWGDVKILPDTSSHTVIKKLREIFSYFGIPEVVVSDNGPQFTSHEFDTFMKTNGIRHVKSAPWHPRTNGAAERFVQTFKMGMKKNNASIPLEKRLCNFLLSYRNQIHGATNASPAQLMFGRNLRNRLNLLYPDVRRDVEAKQHVEEASNSSPRKFEVGNEVWTRMYNAGPKWKLGKVSKVTGPLSYVVRCDGVQMNRHIDQLKSNNKKDVCELSGESDPVSRDPFSGYKPAFLHGPADSADKYCSAVSNDSLGSDTPSPVSNCLPIVQPFSTSAETGDGSSATNELGATSAEEQPVPGDSAAPAEQTPQRYPSRARKEPDRLML